MKKSLTAFLFLAILLFTSQAIAITYYFDPPADNIMVNDSLSIDLNVSGLTDGGPDSLGAFALDIAYDDTVLDFTGVTFGLDLGDPDNYEADIYYDDSLSGIVYLDETSWLYDDELDALQNNSFTLATLEFIGTGSGTSIIGIENLSASDAFGLSFSDPVIQTAAIKVSDPVPVPATLVLLASGFLGIAGLRRKK